MARPITPLSNGAPFAIGFGNNEVTNPWKFVLGQGVTSEIGFFELYTTNAPIDLIPITQATPLQGSANQDYHNARKVEVSIRPIPNIWITKTIAVIQRHKE